MRRTIVADMRAGLRWAGAELVLMLGWLREVLLWLALALAALVALLAYQVTPSYTIAIGGDRATHLRGYDSPFLDRFNDSEPDRAGVEWWSLPEPAYRWTQDQAAIRFPGIGGETWLLDLHLGSGRPANAATEALIVAGNRPAQALHIPAQPRHYRLLASAERGDLLIQFQAQRFQAPGDPRSLGIVAYRVQATPLTQPIQAPAFGQLILQSLILGLIYAIARRLGVALRVASAAIVLVGLILAALLVSDRLGLTIATPGLLVIALACWLMVGPMDWLLRAGSQRMGLRASVSERGSAIGTALAGFAIRLIGATHPYARYSDLRFNANNLLRSIRGELLLTAGLPCEAGAGRAPYPPAEYLTIAPLQLLFPLGGPGNEALWAIQGSVALLEASGAAFIWVLLRRLGAGKRAALLGAACYMLPLPLLRSYTIGEMANVFGQVLVPPLLLLLATWNPNTKQARWGLVAGALVGGLFLSHTGVTISAVCLLGAWGMLQLRQLKQLRMLARASLVAGALAIVVFYSAFIDLPAANRANAATLRATTGQVCPPGRPFGEKLLATLELGIGAHGALLPPLVVAGAVGALSRRRNRIGLLLAATMLGTLLSFATLFGSDQPVRWAHFVYPAICVAAGVGLAEWGRRGRAGAIVAVGLLLALIWLNGAAWVSMISDYLH